MNRKGQALIEFVLILPVLIMILFIIFDFGNIFYSKYELQNQSMEIVRLVKDKKEIEEINDIYSKIDIEINTYKEDYKKITLTKELDLITPLLDNILDDPYLIKIERIIPNV